MLTLLTLNLGNCMENWAMGCWNELYEVGCVTEFADIISDSFEEHKKIISKWPNPNFIKSSNINIISRTDNHALYWMHKTLTQINLKRGS